MAGRKEHRVELKAILVLPRLHKNEYLIFFEPVFTNHENAPAKGEGLATYIFSFNVLGSPPGRCAPFAASPLKNMQRRKIFMIFMYE